MTSSPTGDDDSGTDENGDTPPFSPTPPPSSGFLMAKKMKIGCSSEPSSQSNDPSFDQDDGLTHSSALAVMFASSVPTPDDLAQLKKKKKVRGDLDINIVVRRVFAYYSGFTVKIQGPSFPPPLAGPFQNY
jgi:hypothetical protein